MRELSFNALLTVDIDTPRSRAISFIVLGIILLIDCGFGYAGKIIKYYNNMPTFADVYLDFYSAIVCTIRITADNEKKYASVILF